MSDQVSPIRFIDRKALLSPTLRRMTLGERVGYFSNVVVRRAYMQWVRRFREFRARLSGRRFTCRALNGESTYNITVNADLSVSCNCNDVHGQGRLGSLRQTSFEQVFDGPVASTFRQALAEGRLPIAECTRCPELQWTTAADAAGKAARPSYPKGVLFENNAGCNLSCVGCARAERPLESLKMRIADVREVSAQLKRIGVQEIAFFTLGEPFMSRNILDELQAIRADHPKARLYTSTNGVLLDNDDKRRAALLLDDIVISLDGCSQETVVRYQVGSDFGKAFENMKELVALRDREHRALPTITWKYLVFRWNDRAQHVARALELARAARVDRLNFMFTPSPFWGVSPRFHTRDYWRRLAPVVDGCRTVELR